ncbi:hypothetical protein MLC59_19520 [Marinobacter bryozoorum]|uniref:ABC transporter permease subunit n=1 Tax=Marinobacter bryozoorum TaxID=256324 RepID=UPI00200359A7|nr:hypothetical protein [Marinobacter bryozoorum]MCK7546344.1 hypothetical protein [Marinobacter bryozoorum]
MFSEFLQYLFTGITIGATYALVALGFTIIYNASHVINFAQGEFLMIGGMGTVAFMGLCVFQTKVATDSRRSLPPIPRESCH